MVALKFRPLWWSLAVLGTLVTAAAVITRSWAQASVSEVTVTGDGAQQFPQVSGTNLEGRRFHLPADFAGELNLVALAFRREQQDIIDTWTPAASRLTGADRRLRFYEVPVLSEANGRFSAFIDGGMRAGIPDPATRAVTITVYLDQDRLLGALGLAGDRNVHVLLVDRQGRVHWRGRGAYTAAQGEALEQALGA